MEDEEKIEETVEAPVIETDFEALYKSGVDEIDKLHREVTDLKRDKDELQRRLNDATKAFSLIADRLGVVDIADVDITETGGYVEVIDEEDFDKYITY